jgi:DNA polymerase-3 subunit delta'
MQWESFIGHQLQRKWFSNALKHHRLASTFLFVGPNGIGKKTFAYLVAKSLLCTETPDDELACCNRCETCVQLEAQTHPDLIYLARDEDKTRVTMDQIVNEQSGLCYELRIRPYSGRRKIAIIDDADTLETEQSNSLLKTLEEPPPGAIIFLIGTSEHLQLSTIRSRSQIVRFAPLHSAELAKLLVSNKLAGSLQEATELADNSHGSLELAKQFQDSSFNDFRSQLVGRLQQRPMNFVGLCKFISDHLKNEVGEGQERRNRLRWIFDETTEILRSALHQRVGASHSNRPSTSPFAFLDISALTKLIELTIKAREDISRFIAPVAIIEAWTAEFTSIAQA